MTSLIETELDKIRWKMIELFKAHFKGQQPTGITRDEGDFCVNEHGICHPDAGTEFKSFRFFAPEPWDEMPWEYLACVASNLSSHD